MARIVQERPYKFAAEPHLDLSQNELNALHEDFEFLKNEFVAENSYGQEYREAVDQINLSVHRFEALNDPVDSSHIQVLYDPTTRVPFTDQGYSLFQTTRAFGHLYLTYGLTGVPVISAYHSRATGKPRLQDVYTEGFIMYFGETDEFGEWENLEKYIKENYDLDANDPKVTIGFVPLGVLETEFTDTAEIHQFLSTAKEIGRVSCK